MDTTVLVVGGTGRTGRLLVTQLLARGVRVRAIVRAAERLPEAARRDPRLAAIAPSRSNSGRHSRVRL